jgi:hypothetical protein
MKIIKKTYLVEFPETIENGSSKILCDKPYYIERTETDGEVIWWGCNTNWKSINGEWYMLIAGEFVPCDEPEYEIEFKKEMNKN